MRNKIYHLRKERYRFFSEISENNIENAGDLSKGGQYDGITEETAYRITCIEDLVEWANNPNTYKDKNINTDKIFEKGYSTKEGNTGLGLWEIRQILKKNSNLNLFTTKNSEFFTQQFEIFYK